MTPRPVERVQACTPEQARSRRSQARAFIEVADLVLSEERQEAHVAAALAVLAGIAASDAICGLLLRQWSRGSDHRQAVTLLKQANVSPAGLPEKLGRLLADKDAVHYSANLVTVSKARSMVRLAHALVDAAERV